MTTSYPSILDAMTAEEIQFFEKSGKIMRDFWKTIQEEVDLLISHSPITTLMVVRAASRAAEFAARRLGDESGEPEDINPSEYIKAFRSGLHQGALQVLAQTYEDVVAEFPDHPDMVHQIHFRVRRQQAAAMLNALAATEKS